MNILDIIFVVLILSFTLLSWSRGALKEVLSLAGLGLGFFGATAFYPDLAEQLTPVLPDPALAELLSFLLILMLGYFAGVLFTGFSDALSGRRNESWNRILGALIGLCKGVLVSLVLFWVIDTYIPSFQDELARSLVAEELARLLAMIRA